MTDLCPFVIRESLRRTCPAEMVVGGPRSTVHFKLQESIFPILTID